MFPIKKFIQVYALLAVLLSVFTLSACGKMTAQEKADYHKIGKVLQASGIDSDYYRQVQQKQAEIKTIEELDALLDDMERRLDILVSGLKAIRPESEKGRRVHKHLLGGSGRALAAYRKVKAEQGFTNPESIREFDREITAATQDIETGRNLFFELLAKDVTDNWKKQH